MKIFNFFIILSLFFGSESFANFQLCRKSVSIQNLNSFSLMTKTISAGNLQHVERREIEIEDGKTIVYRDISFNTKSMGNFLRLNSINALIQKNSEHLVREYVTRRNWTESFAKIISNEVQEDLPHSRYFLTEEIPAGDAPKIPKAMLKLVFANETEDYLLPVERHLNIVLADNNGLKIEPSNFVNLDQKPKSIEQVLKLWFAYTRSTILNGQVNPDKNLYYTYGDRLSARKYREYGFVKSDITYKDSEGTEWYLLSATPNQVMNSTFLKHKLKEEKKYYLSDIIYLAEKDRYPRLGKTTNYIKNFGNGSRFITESEFLYESKEHTHYFNVYAADQAFLSSFRIPDNFRILGQFSYQGYDFKYRNNELSITRKLEHSFEYIIIDLEKDKDFFPKKIRHHFKTGDELIYSYEAIF